MKKRFRVKVSKDKKTFSKSASMMNSKNLPTVARGGIRF